MRGSASFDSVEVEWLNHASFKLKDSDGFVVYVDPWSDFLEGDEEKADAIISTHDHFDHFDKKAIQSLKKRDTVLVCTSESEDEVPEDLSYKVIEPGRSVKAHGLRVKGVHAYNIDKFREPDTPYHPKGFSTGVIFELDGTRFYHASDTDPIPEMESLPEDIDVAFLPVGGKYTMDQEEAVEAVKKIKPGKVVPMHYGYIDETTADPEKFRSDVAEETGSEAVVLED
ncbi:MAG: MBL fold metallo-hydrolase [Candidatus Nanohaloarchaea archaeon]